MRTRPNSARLSRTRRHRRMSRALHTTRRARAPKVASRLRQRTRLPSLRSCRAMRLRLSRPARRSRPVTHGQVWPPHRSRRKLLPSRRQRARLLRAKAPASRRRPRQSLHRRRLSPIAAMLPRRAHKTLRRLRLRQLRPSRRRPSASRVPSTYMSMSRRACRHGWMPMIGCGRGSAPLSECSTSATRTCALRVRMRLVWLAWKSRCTRTPGLARAWSPRLLPSAASRCVLRRG